MPRLSPTLTRLGRILSQQRSLAISTNHPDLLRPTRRWIESIVVGQKLCPFAKPLLDDGLRLVVSTGSEDEMTRDIAEEVRALVGDGAAPDHQTTLVVLDADNLSFRDLVRFSWRLQEEAVGDHVDRLQLVLFHPLAVHQTYADETSTSAGDYTIRSPFATVHLLRESDVLEAVASYRNLEHLPARNQERLAADGRAACRARLQACYEASR